MGGYQDIKGRLQRAGASEEEAAAHAAQLTRGQTRGQTRPDEAGVGRAEPTASERREGVRRSPRVAQVARGKKGSP